jgi:hypothetical protein
VFDAVVIMLKCLPCIERRVNVDALYFAGEILFECFEGEEVVAVDEHIFCGVSADAVFGVVEEDAGFELRFVSFANPGEFEFLHIGRVVCSVIVSVLP